MSDLFQLKGTIVINNKDANEEIDETTGKAKDLADALGGAGEDADKTGQKLGSSGKLGSGSVWLGNMMTKMTDMALKVGKYVGQTGIGFNASMEAYQNQFASLLGDSDKAAQLVADLQLLAKISPLGMEGLALNAVSLLNAGTELTDIIPTLETLGNLSLGDTNKMNSVVRAYTQIMSKGKLMAQEMYQLGDAGVPVREILTKYGGERFADGEWYGQMQADPKKFVISAEEMANAFKNATADGGKWHDYMLNMMDTWNGQVDHMGEESKESLGALMKPFFEMAKSDVLPKLADSLALFGTWATENQDTIEKMAEALGNIATVSFDAALNFFRWITENGDAVGVAVTTIASAMAIAAISMHPYAAAIMAIAAGLAWLTSEEGKQKRSYDHFFDGHDQEALDALQEWVEAKRALKEADDTFQMNVSDEEYDALVDAADAAARKVNELDDSLIGLYNEWRSGQENPFDYLDVPLRVAEDTEAAMQGELDSFALDAIVTMYPDYSQLYNFPGFVSRNVSKNRIEGSHADGLDYVPHDGYIAQLHKGETVLNAASAAAWRSGGGNSRIEALLAQLVANTSGGQQIVLDSGVLVGQIAPQMDARLGTITKRKGRGN